MASSAAGTASAKKPRTTRKATKAKDVPVVVALEDEEEEQAALTLSVEEKDTLDCDICCLPFESQLFMASSNYLACTSVLIRYHHILTIYTCARFLL